MSDSSPGFLWHPRRLARLCSGTHVIDDAGVLQQGWWPNQDLNAEALFLALLSLPCYAASPNDPSYWALTHSCIGPFIPSVQSSCFLSSQPPYPELCSLTQSFLESPRARDGVQGLTCFLADAGGSCRLLASPPSLGPSALRHSDCP